MEVTADRGQSFVEQRGRHVHVHDRSGALDTVNHAWVGGAKRNAPGRSRQSADRKAIMEWQSGKRVEKVNTTLESRGQRRQKSHKVRGKNQNYIGLAESGRILGRERA